MKQIRDGLNILLKYEPDGDCAAEHDVFYVGGGKPEDISEEDRAELEKLGWFWDDSLDSWSTFT